jgi:hypothetical protein
LPLALQAAFQHAAAAMEPTIAQAECPQIKTPGRSQPSRQMPKLAEIDSRSMAQ